MSGLPARGVWWRFAAVGLFVGAVAAVALEGPAGLPADRFEVDYPSNPGFGRADPPEGTFVDLSAGAFRTCGVRTTGEIECWGDDFGEPPPGRFAKVDIWDLSGVGNGCAVAADASVECWSVLGRADAPDGDFVDVSVAVGFACGLRTDASVACWEFMRGSYDASYTPEGPFVEVHAGRPPCGLRTSGALVCWGDHAHDVVRQDDSFWDERLVAVAPGWGSIERYFWREADLFPYDFVCGIRPDSTLACSSYHRDPTGEFVQVDRTAGPVCALRTDRSIACFNLTNVRRPGLPDPPPGEFTDIAVGPHHACAIRVDGTVACWGDNSNRPQRPTCESPCPLR